MRFNDVNKYINEMGIIDEGNIVDDQDLGDTHSTLQEIQDKLKKLGVEGESFILSFDIISNDSENKN